MNDVFIMGKLRTIAEKRLKRVAVMKDIFHNVTDSRPSPSYLIRACKNDSLDLVYFSVLWRTWAEFVQLKKCTVQYNWMQYFDIKENQEPGDAQMGFRVCFNIIA